MLERPIDVSSGKATPSSCELEYDATIFEDHLVVMFMLAYVFTLSHIYLGIVIILLINV